MEKNNEDIEVQGVIFTPEMLESLRTLQANDNDKIKIYMERINWMIRDIISLSTMSGEMYEETIINVDSLFDIIDLMKSLETK